MRKEHFAKNIIGTLDVSRPVTVLLVGNVAQGMRKAALAAISPTSRLLVMNTHEVHEDADERVERILKEKEDLVALMHEHHVARCDAIILGKEHFTKEEWNKFFAQSARILSQGGVCIAFPFPKAQESEARKLFSKTVTSWVWKGFLPVRVFWGRK